MLRMLQMKNSQQLNLTVFYTFLTYLCKGSPCCVSTVALVHAFFAVIFPQHFTFQNSQFKFVAFIMKQLYWHILPEDLGMVETCTVKSNQKFSVVWW